MDTDSFMCVVHHMSFYLRVVGALSINVDGASVGGCALE